VRVVNTWRIRRKTRWRERGGHSCLAFARAGLGYLYIESKVWVTIYATQRKWEVGEREEEMSKLGPARDRHAASYAKGSPVNNKRGGNE